MPNDRSESAYRVRVEAAELARHRTHPKHESNSDEARYGAACYPMNFTKGLEHDWETGLVAEPAHFEAFRSAIDAAFAESFTTRVPVPRVDGERRRAWEAPTAGVVFELEGPDPQAVTMPPAPELGSDELTFEMAEVYELALLRDVPFTEFADGSPAGGPVDLSADRLNKLPYAINEFLQGRDRKASEGVDPVTGDSVVQLDPQTLFRGSSPGVEHGPYLSQFLLIGTKGDPEAGKIAYGAQIIDQRVIQAETKDDYMMVWDEWLRVQRGFDPRDPGALGQKEVGNPRFICTPRDLATYVHVDQLYQAYLNACLILLGQGAQFDPAFGLLSGQGKGVLETPSSQEFTAYNAGGFALWGGPHILSLVTEVATRGLKAVRFQKFNNHLRLRPEALAARIEKAAEIEDRNPSVCNAFSKMRDDLSMAVGGSTAMTVDAVRDHNNTLAGGPTALLPMAFAEGSPMHPTYGAGHATVAGVCVTMLKAFFDTSAIFVRVSSGSDVSAHFYTKDQIIDAIKRGAKVEYGSYSAMKKKDEKIKTLAGEKYSADSELSFEVCGYFNLELNHLGDEERAAAEKAKDKASPFYQKDLSKIPNRYLEVLTKGKKHCCPLTLEGELNKLAANISIGRNMAGVHYFSDYYDSARMGEEIAIGILEEQALCYPTDDFVLSLPTFDGDTVRVGRK